ncbi:MAG: hypothetical protein ACK5OX_06985 [Desertimonas sp.]
MDDSRPNPVGHPVTMLLIDVDDDERISLAGLLPDLAASYLATVTSDGTITLAPAGHIDEREAATLRNPTVMRELVAGINEARSGKASPLDWAIFDSVDG